MLYDPNVPILKTDVRAKSLILGLLSNETIHPIDSLYYLLMYFSIKSSPQKIKFIVFM